MVYCLIVSQMYQHVEYSADQKKNHSNNEEQKYPLIWDTLDMFFV